MKKTHKRGHRINAVLSVIIGILLALICAIAAYATVTASSSTWTPYGGNLARKLLVKVTTTGKNVDAAKYTVTATGAMGIYKDNLKASINGDVFIQSSGTDSHTHKAMTTKNYTYKDGGTDHTGTYYKIGSKSATYTKAHSSAKKYGFAHCQKPKTTHTPLRNATAKEAVTVPAHAQYTVTYNANTLDTAGNKILGTPSGIPAVSVNCTSAVTCQDSVDKIQCDKSDTKLANPTLTGYIFGGWNTSSDGSGAAYKAGADAPDKSITLYAQWTKEPDKKAQFDTGRNVNVKLKKLAGNSSAAYTSTDNTIKEIKRSAAAPASGVTTVDLSPEQSGYLSIPAWISNGTVYYYCSEQNISLAEDSSYMLYLLSSVASIDTSGWNSYPAVNMSRMFSGCKSIKTIDVSKFQTESCEVMDYMFDMCNALTSLNLSNFCFEKVDSAEGMFKSCSAITEITFPKSENARSITNTAHMFEWCGSIKRIDLSGLDFEGITNADNMFYGCASLEHLNISSLDMRSFGSSVTKFYGGMGALKTIVLGRNCILTPVADTFPPSGTWKNMSTGKKYSETELVEAFDANPLGMAATYEKMSYSFSKKSTNTAKTGIDVKRITPQNGKAKLEAQLKHGQKLNIFGLNDGAKYKITEKGTKQYAPSYTTEAEKATRLKASADIGLDLSTPEEMIGPNAVYNFVNTKTEQEGYELAIKKKLSGDLIENSDKDREFNFYYHIKGLDPDVSYKIYLPGAAVSEDSEDYDASLVKSVTPTTDKKQGDIGYDTSGEIEEYFSMKAGGDDITKAYRIEGLPKGAQFIVEEIAASGEGTTLPDGFETEFPYDTTVSDADSITKDGTGEEKEVTENTVENRNSTWTYTIKQEVQPGASNFSITDYMPPYLETILSEDPDNNLVHAKFYKKDGTAVEGAIVKTDAPSENPDAEEVTTYKNDAYSISYDTSDISGTLTASLHDKELLKAGGTAELTFTVFLPPDVSMDELKEAGCINSDASEIKFKNQGETIVSDNKFDTNQTTTHIPLDTGLTIKKNVIGKLGDKTKEFKYNINLQNLTPETEYTFSTPENVTVSAEYNSNTGQITFTALNEKKNPKKNVNISIYENTEDRDRIGTISTGKDGTATMNLSTGDYVAAISGTEQTFSIETTYAGSGVGTVTTAIEGYKQMVVPSKGEITKFSSDANGKADVSFTLKHGKSVSFDDLPAGATYNVTELADPQYTASYVVQKGVGTVTTPTKTNFSNNEEISTGENSLVAENAVTIQFNNVVNTKKITINKVQAGGSQELSGAKLTLKNSYGDTIETWVSDGKAKDLEVAYGETYTLTEDDAPAGYEIAESITFRITSEGLLEIKKDGSWQEQKTANVTMKDDLSEFDIEFEKRDFRTKDMLSGAELVLKTSNGKVIKSWTSTSTSEKIKLTKGDYILSESSAPKGYDKTEDIRFSVNESGKVVSSTSQTAVNDKTVTMYDDKESKNVVIEKKVKGSLGDTEYDFHFTGTFTGLTKGVTYEVGDNLTMKADENGNAKVTFTLKDGEKIIIKKLPVGATYTFAEEGNNHKASYEITSDEKNAVIAKKEAANDESNKALSTEIENVDSTDGNINVTFINYRGLTAVTGIPGDIHHLLLAITLCGLIVGAIVKRKKKYKL